jgi:hypothetical protein
VSHRAFRRIVDLLGKFLGHTGSTMEHEG